MRSLKLMIFGLVLVLASVGLATVTLFAAKVDNDVIPILGYVLLVLGVVVTAVGLLVGLLIRDRKDGDGKKEDPKDKQ